MKKIVLLLFLIVNVVILMAQDINFSSEYNKLSWPIAQGLSGGLTGDDGSYKRLALYHGGSISLQTGSNNPGISNSRLFINSTGAIGIGTIAPDGFQINTLIGSETSQGVTNMRMGVLNGTPRLIFDTQGFTPFQIDNKDGQLRIFNPGLVRMVVSPNGYVGIGTTTPDALLTVSGQVHAQEVKVTVNAPGPDYVFEKDYALPSLDQIKTYIEKNKHLPEVPSAKEMEKNGVQLGEMNMLLLKKIEELTLYVIELKRENKEQQKLIEKYLTNMNSK